MILREMLDTDWDAVAEIYTQGVVSGHSTFNRECPSFADWNSGHIREGRYVAVNPSGQVVGWVALSHTSTRIPYWGVVEVSIYIHYDYHGQGIGTLLLEKVIAESKVAGFWSLYVAIFSKNTTSIALHRKCGFRTIGYRERIAKDIFGQWQDTTLMERRL